MSIATMPEPKAAATVAVMNGDELYEIVNGERVEVPPMSAYSTLLGSRLFGAIFPIAENNKIGTAICEALFILDPVADLRRRPDVAFISKERWPLDRPVPEAGDWLVVPDLAVEVISPNDTLENFLEKLEEYFKYKVKQVWVVLPRRREVMVYTSAAEHRTLTLDQELDGGDILPGFRLKLAELFNQPLAAKSE